MILNFPAKNIEIDVDLNKNPDGSPRLNVIVTASAEDVLYAIEKEGGMELIRQYALEYCHD